MGASLRFAPILDKGFAPGHRQASHCQSQPSPTCTLGWEACVDSSSPRACPKLGMVALHQNGIYPEAWWPSKLLQRQHSPSLVHTYVYETHKMLQHYWYIGSPRPRASPKLGMPPGIKLEQILKVDGHHSCCRDSTALPWVLVIPKPWPWMDNCQSHQEHHVFGLLEWLEWAHRMVNIC